VRLQLLLLATRLLRFDRLRPFPSLPPGLDARIVPILLTAGSRTSAGEGGRLNVPKKEVVGVLQVLLQNRRLEIASTLAHAATLVKELAAFRVKVTAAGNEELPAWRERAHDDLVLAVGLAAWLAEQVARSGAEGEEPDTVVLVP
jgi:hypothetical protein